MPEGPEVRRAADKIQRAIAGQPLQRVILEHPKLYALTGKLEGSVLKSVQTFSKAFVLTFDDLLIYVHLQLYGVWKTGPKRTPPKTNRSLRLWLETKTHYAALYSATDVQPMTPFELRQHPYIKKLGPDLLSQPNYGISHISRRLSKKEFSRRSLGHLLLDQSFFAGIGNYLRSEILFEAGLHPTARIGQLSPKKRTKLARAIHTMLHRAYRTGGITTDPQIIKASKAKRQRRSQYRYYVFARQNQNCRVCQTKIEKIEVAGRRLYLCSTCQPKVM